MGQQRAAQQAVKRAMELAAQVKAGIEAADGKGQVGGEQGQASNEVQEQSARPVVEGVDASCIAQTPTATTAAAPKPGPAPVAAVAAAGASGGDDSTSVLPGSGDKDLSVGAQPAEDGGAGTLPGGAGKGSPAGAATCCPEAADPAKNQAVKPDAKVLAAAEAVRQLREEAGQLRAALAACRARKEALGAKLQRAQRLADLQVRCGSDAKASHAGCIIQFVSSCIWNSNTVHSCAQQRCSRGPMRDIHMCSSQASSTQHVAYGL